MRNSNRFNSKERATSRAKKEENYNKNKYYYYKITIVFFLGIY
jgi:hypothetical protein